MYQIALVLLLYACTLLLPGTAFAQGCWVQGTVRLSDSEQHSGISVQLLDAGGTKVLGFRTTDARGQFSLTAPEGESRLYLAQFGYQDTMLSLHCRSDTLRLGTLTLAPLSLDLEEISVVDKAALLRKSGDTTIFNIQLLEIKNTILTLPSMKFRGPAAALAPSKEECRNAIPETLKP